MIVASAIPCLQCGNVPTQIVNKARLVFQGGVTTAYTNVRRSSGQAGYIPLTDLCLSCLFDSEIAAARMLLNVTDSASENTDAWSIQCFPGYGFDKEWRDFSVLVFGREISPDIDPDSCPWPSLGFRSREEGSRSETQVWLRRVRYRDTALYVEGRWNPTLRGEQVTLHGLMHDIPDSVVHQALRGRRLLQILSQHGGRPRGSGRFRDADECKEAVLEVIRNELEQDRKPNQADIEYLLFNADSGGRQLRRALKPYRWSDLLGELAREYPNAF